MEKVVGQMRVNKDQVSKQVQQLRQRIDQLIKDITVSVSTSDYVLDRVYSPIHRCFILSAAIHTAVKVVSRVIKAVELNNAALSLPSVKNCA